MNKLTHNDSDSRLKLNKSPKFRQNNSEERVLATGLRSIAQEEIKQLFRKEIKTHLPTLQLHKSRDVSHLKDLNSPKSHFPFTTLPTDLKSLRLIIESKPDKRSESKKSNKKIDFIQKIVSQSPESEINDEGVPTSRKEAENLLRWFKIMKAKQDVAEEFELVALIAGQEVLKQVKGQCKHLGIVLKSVLQFYKNSLDRGKKQREQENEVLKLSYEAKIERIENGHKDEVEKWENKVKELVSGLEKNKSVVKGVQDDLTYYKNKLNDVQRLYLTEQDVWRKRNLELLRETVRSSIKINHESYKLAVARWRKDLFTAEIEQQPNVDLPEIIREKLETEQSLTPDELDTYRELYYKAEEEKYKKRFLDSETQTIDDPQNDLQYLKPALQDPDHQFEDSFVKLSKHIEATEKILETVYDSKVITKDKSIQAEPEQILDDEVLKEFEIFLNLDEDTQDKEETDQQSNNSSEENESEEEKLEIEGKDEDEKKLENEKLEKEEKKSEIFDTSFHKSIKKLKKIESRLDDTKTKPNSRVKNTSSLKKAKTRIETSIKRSLPRSPKTQQLDRSNLSKKPPKPLKTPKTKRPLTKSPNEPLKKQSKIEQFEISSNNSDLPSAEALKFLLNQSIPKPETDLSHSQDFPKARTPSLKLLKSSQIQNLISTKLAPALQKSKTLKRLIQEKHVELENINTQVVQKRKLLISLSNQIEKFSQPNEITHKRVSSEQLVEPSKIVALNDSVLSQNKIKVVPNIQIIDEVNEDIEINAPDGLDAETWKTGFVVGFTEGKIVGFNKGKEFAGEEMFIEGYAEATRDMENDKEIEKDEEIDGEEKKGGRSEVTSPTGRVVKRSKILEVKSQRELTKFSEFNFMNKKITPRKSNTLTQDSISVLLKKLPEFIRKKTKVSRKMLNKMITGFYEVAFTQMLVEGVREMLFICYDEIAHRYGLKKVADRKFLEFLSGVIKNKDHKRCAVFLKLANMNQFINTDSYSRQSLLLYLESYKYMLGSKIGIVTNYDETEDRILFPLNRAIDCIKEKLENKVEKVMISHLISTVEHRSAPDPRKINTGLIELELVLESICDCFESYQQKIRNFTKRIFARFIHNDLVPNYVFHIIMRIITSPKYSKIEELSIKTDLSLEEINDLSIGLSLFVEQDLNSLTKPHSQHPFASYEELLQILTRMQEKKQSWISFSCDEWKIMLDDCKAQHQSDEFSSLLWRVYEAELRRINSELSVI